MSLNIITNTSTLTAARALNKNQKALAQNFQRLSTGLRINSAKDDAAGLAIANRLTAQFRGLNQAVRNANDTISLVQTAESAIAEQQSMLQRLRELAVQSSSDTVSSSDRAAIQQEADALSSEIDRIAQQTTYNGTNLLDGSLSNFSFQVGAYQNETIDFTLAGTRSFNLGSIYTTTTSTVDTTTIAAGEVTLNGFAVRASVAADDVFSSGSNDVSAIAKANAINASTNDHGVTATANASVVTGTAAITASTNAAGSITINGVDIGAVTVLANDSDQSLRDAINAVSSATGVQASIDSSDQLVLTGVDGRNIITSGAAVANIADATWTGTLSLESESSFIISGSSEAAIGAQDAQTVSTLQATNASNLDLSSQSTATTAISSIDDAIGQLNGRQSTIGALLNRLDNAVSSLAAAAENVAAARGQIMDADFASETASFSKNQILQQASVSILAQANVQGQLALQLLG